MHAHLHPDTLGNLHAEAYLGRSVTEAVITVPGTPPCMMCIVPGSALYLCSALEPAISG